MAHSSKSDLLYHRHEMKLKTTLLEDKTQRCIIINRVSFGLLDSYEGGGGLEDKIIILFLSHLSCYLVSLLVITRIQCFKLQRKFYLVVGQIQQNRCWLSASLHSYFWHSLFRKHLCGTNWVLTTFWWNNRWCKATLWSRRKKSYSCKN